MATTTTEDTKQESDMTRTLTRFEMKTVVTQTLSSIEEHIIDSEYCCLLWRLFAEIVVDL